MEIFASVLGAPVETIGGAHGPAYGAAIIAAQGIGLLEKTSEAIATWVPSGTAILQNTAWSAVYERLYPIFRDSYTATREIAGRLAAL